MSARRWPALLAVTLVSGLLMTAAAQGGEPTQPSAPCSANGDVGSLIFLPAPAQIVSDSQFPICTTGSVTVTFRGTRPQCVSVGRCRYAGTESWRPGDGVLSAITYRRAGRLHTTAFVTWNRSSLNSEVHRATKDGRRATCHDSSDAFGGFAVVRSGRIPLSLLDESLLPTRCATPLITDLPRARFVRSLNLGQVRSGRALLRLATTARFAAHGFNGQVSMDVVLRTGQRLPNPEPAPPRPKHPVRMREVTVSYHVDGISGQMRARWHHPAGGSCARLDACGITGATRLSPAGAIGTLAITAMGPARRPYRDFLAALGLSTTGRPHGITLAGGGSLNSRGSSTTTVLQNGNRCTDRNGLIGTGFGIQARAGKLVATYQMGGFAGDALRSRCPGPDLGDHPAATASVPLSALAPRQVHLVFRHPVSFVDRGYRVRIQGAPAVTLTRTGISQRIT